MDIWYRNLQTPCSILVWFVHTRTMPDILCATWSCIRRMAPSMELNKHWRSQEIFLGGAKFRFIYRSAKIWHEKWTKIQYEKCSNFFYWGSPSPPPCKFDFLRGFDALFLSIFENFVNFAFLKISVLSAFFCHRGGVFAPPPIYSTSQIPYSKFLRI